MPKSLVNRIRLIYLPIDLVFGIVIPLAVVNGIEPADWTWALLVFYLLGIGRTLGNMIMIGRIFGPPAHWASVAAARPDGRELRDADEALRNSPRRFTLVVMSLWAIQLIAGMLVLLFVDRYHAGIAVRSLVTVAFMIIAIVLGSIPFTTPLMSLLTHTTARRLCAIAHGAGLPLQRERASLKAKLIVLIASTGLAGPLWMASTGYSADSARVIADARALRIADAADLARQAADVDPANTEVLTRLASQASVRGAVAGFARPGGDFVAPHYEPAPPIEHWLHIPLAAPGGDSASNPRDAQVAARAPTGKGLYAVVVAPISDWATSSMATMLVFFFIVIILWAPACAYFLARDVVEPLDDITKTIIQVTEIGKLDEVAAITVTQNDEIGILAARFNDLIDTLRDLSGAAGALAKGDLEIKLEGEGDVATAFRVMINSLGRIVRQIHETSVLLAAAATEIYAASQEQEAAAASQSTAMVEIRQTMESLFEAAAHVSESVRGVLSNAERTLETTDRMVIRIGDLTTHAGRIGEILETIRDISDRSDLLALNGALEASRAGEAGRGFGLVAGEMRRLAERVLSSVHDVRSLVGDIRASGSSTMMATEDSKKLAASTTDAARQITLVTQQQRSGTEQVLQSVREIAETLTQSVAAMAQTRASAEQLKSQADKLASLVQAFRIETPPT
ncbi:MAG: methyl-accepting chemotaxis protein [Deltaproteobacteria bacterium]|nr:MAG: methyl-accepting chemotaxis protein [Deltaproteobacteria bacterium]TMQ07968.1 MAG: methyl-accepting chemotaxis protein [Deltaproteobacteria bacterium]